MRGDNNYQMVYQTIQEANVTGLDGILVYINSAIPIFTPALLIAVYLAISLMIYLGTKRYGQGDIFAAMSAAGFFVVVLGTIMTLTFGIINIYSITVTILIAVVSFVLLMIRRNRD